MKLEGHTFNQPNIEYCVLPRSDGPNIVFKCGPVFSYDEFERLCPLPEPPTQIRKGGVKVPDLQDESYLQQVSDHGDNRIHYIILISLAYTEDLEWETVDMGKPTTWKNYVEELKKAFFNEQEIGRIRNTCFAANSLNESRVEEARANFLLGLGEEKERLASLQTEQNSSPSGEPAKGLG